MVFRLLDFGAFQISGLEMPISKHKYWKVGQKSDSEILCSWAVQREDVPPALKHTSLLSPHCAHSWHTVHTLFHAAPSLLPQSLLWASSTAIRSTRPPVAHMGENSKISLSAVVSAEPTDDAFTGNQNSPPRMPARVLSFSILLAYQL